MTVSLTREYRAVRRYEFREIVAEIDFKVCMMGAGPLDLPLSTLRQLWSTATFAAETQQMLLGASQKPQEPPRPISGVN